VTVKSNGGRYIHALGHELLRLLVPKFEDHAPLGSEAWDLNWCGVNGKNVD